MKRSPKFLYFRHETTSKSETERDQEATTPGGGVGAPGRATLWCGAPRCPLTSPLRLYNPSNTKTLNQSAFSQLKFHSAAVVEDQFWGTEVSILAPCRDEELPPEPSPWTPPPSSSLLLSPMMRRE
jgi:hypothetical protein